MVEILTRHLTPPALPDLIRTLMPEQGAVEVQRDRPGKEHAWHAHPVDETLVILEGSLRFYWADVSGNTETLCRRGDVIRLPAGIRHGSVALEGGVVYLIAPRIVELGGGGTA
ncbi:cupin domain-containing protein [uncultured Tistrella sp.]|mgnify:CR=1 FL=1|uniref:cupin domain-containing protein n=1 Tax=Tistrella mobilis TaxID=171437 RepID=UPI000C08F28C|nr:cupin domain-containing protein [uncultured Tistrella sp.]MAM75779.1 cupin domain protein [Tistrella sp.]